MQNTMMQKLNRWLLPTVLILFICQLILLPWAVGFTWADRSASPDYTLTYTENKLTWESASDKLANGTVVIDLFEPEYDGTVKSEDGRDVVAPGTANSKTIRLQSKVSGAVKYTAVAYVIKGNNDLPVTFHVGTSDTATNAASYPLPDGVTQDQVVQAITGTISGNQRVDFDAAWNWAFEESAQQDVIDTQLGVNGGPNVEAMNVTVGLYIVIEDNNSYVTPGIPQTGDNSHIGLYSGLMLISFIMLILLLLERRREAKRESN